MARIVNDWRIDLMRAHPRLFEIVAEEPKHSFGYPLCEAGWRDVMERLCVRIEDTLQDGETFQFVRIKQKFGVARFDWDGEVSDQTRLRILEAINLAVARSACSCEICGAEGRLYSNRGWLATRCAEHAAAGDPVPVRPGYENVRFLRRTPGTANMYYARYDRATDTLTEVSPRPPHGEE
ncbi:hypothetical protein [Bradyrhizobium sp. RDI18]|uniref:hypothetical protein n=1 Tax=Bradyrhizobium sp. RDI18 TaxID=3367400 RepID=UPI0037132C7D